MKEKSWEPGRICRTVECISNHRVTYRKWDDEDRCRTSYQDVRSSARPGRSHPGTRKAGKFDVVNREYI